MARLKNIYRFTVDDSRRVRLEVDQENVRSLPLDTTKYIWGLGFSLLKGGDQFNG